MKETRRKFSSAFKAEVALEAIKGVKTITELAQEYQVHPVQINTWKKTFLERTANIFEGDKKQEQELKRLREDRDELYLEDPTRGTRRMSKELKKLGYQCGRHHTTIENGHHALELCEEFMEYYNHKRMHSSINDKTPMQVYKEAA